MTERQKSPVSQRKKPARFGGGPGPRDVVRDGHERARDLLAREVGYVTKPHGGRLRVALSFPNTYWVGMSNLGLQTVYQLFNADERVVCERVFLPGKQELADFAAGREPLITIESQTPVRDFDVLAFSVSFEWDYANVVTMLRLAGLQPRAERRHPARPARRHWRRRHVRESGAAGAVCRRDCRRRGRAARAGARRGRSRTRAAGIGRGSSPKLRQARGFYVPSLYDVTYAGPGRVAAITPKPGSDAPPVVHKAAVKAADRLDPPATSIFTPDTEFGSRLLIEVVRGCANLCRFCWAGYNYLPVRPFSTERILEVARAARPHADRIGLVSIALCDHPDIERILGTTRRDGLQHQPGLASA